MRRRDRLTSVLGMIAALAIAIGILVGVMASSAAAAQGVCAPHVVFEKNLPKQYNETPSGIGVMSNGNVLEMWFSPGGSFTVLVTNGRGHSCVVADGEGWTEHKIIVPGDDS